MSVHDFYVGLDAFRRGETRRLPMPESVSTELTTKEDKALRDEAALGFIGLYG